MKKSVTIIFTILVYLSLLTPFWVFKSLFFPFVTSKAFYFRIIILLASPFYLYLIIAFRNLRPNLKNLLNLALLGFLAASLLSAIFGVNTIKSLWGNFERMGGVYYLGHLIALYFYVLLLGQLGGKYIKRFLQLFILVAAVISLNGFSGWLGGPTLTADPSLPARASSTLGNPIYLGSMVILPMFLCLYFFLQEEMRWKKYAYLVLVFLLFSGIYTSATRGALVGLIGGLVAGCLLYSFFTKNKKIKIFGFTGLIIFIALLTAVFYYSQRLPQGSALKRIFNLRDSNSLARITQWKTALQGFKDRPIFGTGPENYYIISDSHFNPQIYKYDPSWFDKPHNYLLEVLTTTGILGFGFYASVLLLGLWGIYLGFRSQFFNLFETTVLAAGFLSYQTQNLFVFDTVSASLTFFVYLAFIAYIWKESNKEVSITKGKTIPSFLLAQTLLVISLILGAYTLYATDIVPLQISKAVNAGNGYGKANPKQAAVYFEKATSLPFNFDKAETATRYTDYALRLLGTELAAKDPAFVRKQVNEALVYQKKVTEEIGNSPILWDRLGSLQVVNALINNQPLDSSIEESFKKALTLVPKRVEIMLSLLQLTVLQKNNVEAVQLANEIVAIDPSRKIEVEKLLKSFE